MNKTIYLCGPIQGRSDVDCRAWRELAKAMWSGKCLDPMDRDYRENYPDPTKWDEARTLAQKIVMHDKEDIRKSDGMLVYFDKPSTGTAMEIYYAWVLRRPIVIINASGSNKMSPWLVHHCNGIANSIDEAIFGLHQLLAPPNQPLVQRSTT